MAQEELYGTRDRTYSAWHRRMSTRRFVGIERAQTLAMIDLDAACYVEYDDITKEPLALIETARDVDQSYKTATVTRNLARRCAPEVRAYSLLYKPADYPNPADMRWPDITSFRAKRIWPDPITDWRMFSPQQWADFLVQLRCQCSEKIDAWLDAMENIHV